MKTEFSPPYRFGKFASHWYVVNDRGGFEMACSCRHEAELFAAEMNREAAVRAGLAGEDVALTAGPDEYENLWKEKE